MENIFSLASPQDPILLGRETHQRIIALTLEYGRKTGKTPERILLPMGLSYALAEYSASLNGVIAHDDPSILQSFLESETIEVDTGRGLVPCVLDPFVPEEVIEIE